ncbi:unnamed protein product [Symbiodinium necroappetens]|uniref:Uncharacterized protein n=1 Tax=Symbiodinium necroappetens TaxID=1628268 RepID=A0A812NPZ6_9DINO|nr:unnamed protein product [Symbiodinium necroappetens]
MTKVYAVDYGENDRKGKRKKSCSIAPSKIDVYVQQEAGQWKEDEEASIERGASKSDWYGYTAPVDPSSGSSEHREFRQAAQLVRDCVFAYTPSPR